MKSLVQVLILIKEEYNKYPSSGLCLATISLIRRDTITPEEGMLFEAEYAKTANRKKRFYDCMDRPTGLKSEWGWKVGNVVGRNKWLNHRIGKYS
jgi:hypothetical protein